MRNTHQLNASLGKQSQVLRSLVESDWGSCLSNFQTNLEFILQKMFGLNFWTESDLAKEKTQNQTQLQVPTFMAFYITAFLCPALRHDSNMKMRVISQKFFTLVFMTSSCFLEDAWLKKKKKMKILLFLICKHLDWVMLPWTDVMDKNIWLIILWAGS